jgi:hypothetical protein
MLDAFIKILTISVWPAVVLWLAWYLRDEIKRVARQDGQSWIERGRIRSASARASRVVAQ